MFKNVAGQKILCFAWNVTTGLSKTGDGANITCKLSKDHGARNPLDNTNPTETEGGFYLFDLLQAETNTDNMAFYPVSSTENIVILCSPNSLDTMPPNFSSLNIETDGDLSKVNLCDENTDLTAHNTKLDNHITALGTHDTEIKSDLNAIGVIVTEINAKLDTDNLYCTISAPSVQLINKNTSEYRFAINVSIRDGNDELTDPDDNEVALQLEALNNEIFFLNPGGDDDTLFDDIELSTPSTESVTFVGDYFKLLKLETGRYQVFVSLKGDDLPKYDDLQATIKYKDDTNNRVYNYHIGLDVGAKSLNDYVLEFSTPSTQTMPENAGYVVSLNFSIKDRLGNLVDPDSNEVALQGLRLNAAILIDENFLFDDFSLSSPATESGTFSPSYFKAFRESTGIYILYMEVPEVYSRDDIVYTVKYKVNTVEKRYNFHMNINESVLTRLVDGKTIAEIQEIVLSMAQGNFVKSVPGEGIERLSFKDQAGSGTLWEVDVDEDGRTRL